MKKKFRPYVYLMGPFTKGDPLINARSMCRTQAILLEDNRCVPYAPLTHITTHFLFPQPYETWLSHDLDMILKMDCGLRMNATYIAGSYKVSESLGADREEQRLRDLGKPVFKSIKELYTWIANH